MRKILALTLFLFISTSYAGVIKTVKAPKVLIEFNDLEAAEGDSYYAINPKTGKRTAILEIIQVKGTKAVGLIKKGNVLTGFDVVKRDAQPIDDTSATSSSSSTESKFGYLFKINTNAMTVSISTENTNMSGTGFGLGVLLDYSLGDKLSLLSSFVYEQFKAAGQINGSLCSGSSSCAVDISYLSGYGLLKYNLNNGKTTVWLGGGIGVLFPLSTSSNALSKISTATVPALAVGADVKLSKSTIPVWFQYNMFQDASTVKGTSMIQINTGYSFN